MLHGGRPHAGKKQTAGLVGSSVVGSGTAFTAYETLNHIVRALKDIPDPANHPDKRVRALHNMKTELIWSSGAAGLGPAAKLLNKTIRHAVGVADEAATKLFWKSVEQGLPMGIAQASRPHWWTKGYASVIGVFPFIGSPFRVQKGKINWLMDQQIVNTLNEIGPVVHMSDLGLLTTHHARLNFDKFAAMNAQLYDDFYARARSLDDAIGAGYIPTTKMKLAAEGLKERVKRGEIRLNTGEIRGGLQAVDDPFEKLMLEMADLPEHMNAHQFRDLQARYNKLWGQYQQKFGIVETDAITAESRSMKRAMEDGFNTTQGWKTAGLSKSQMAQMEKVKETLKDSNTHFANFADDFQSPAAKTVTLVDENIFTAGALKKMGWKYEDQIAHDMFSSFLSGNVRSPKALESLNRLVGADTFRKYARKYMDNLYHNAGEVYQFGFAGKMGWTTPGKAVGMEQLAREQGITVRISETGRYTDEFN